MANADSEPKSSGADSLSENAPKGGGNPRSEGDAGSAASSSPKGSTTPPAGEAPADDNLIAAVAAVSSEAPSHIDTTLDQLTSATDLFDVPAFDFDA